MYDGPSSTGGFRGPGIKQFICDTIPGETWSNIYSAQKRKQILPDKDEAIGWSKATTKIQLGWNNEFYCGSLQEYGLEFIYKNRNNLEIATSPKACPKMSDSSGKLETWSLLCNF